MAMNFVMLRRKPVVSNSHLSVTVSYVRTLVDYKVFVSVGPVYMHWLKGSEVRPWENSVYQYFFRFVLPHYIRFLCSETLKFLILFLVFRKKLFFRVKTRFVGLLKRGERDVYAAEQLVRRQKEAGKNPHYGQNLAMEYLQEACSEYEKNLVELAGRLQRLEEVVTQRMGDQNVMCFFGVDFFLLFFFLVCGEDNFFFLFV